MFCHSDRFNSGLLVGALIGGTIGAVAVILLGSEQGKKLKAEARDKFYDLEEAAEKLLKRKKNKPAEK